MKHIGQQVIALVIQDLQNKTGKISLNDFCSQIQCFPWRVKQPGSFPEPFRSQLYHHHDKKILRTEGHSVENAYLCQGKNIDERVEKNALSCKVKESDKKILGSASILNGFFPCQCPIPPSSLIQIGSVLFA